MTTPFAKCLQFQVRLANSPCSRFKVQGRVAHVTKLGSSQSTMSRKGGQCGGRSTRSTQALEQAAGAGAVVRGAVGHRRGQHPRGSFRCGQPVVRGLRPRRRRARSIGGAGRCGAGLSWSGEIIGSGVSCRSGGRWPGKTGPCRCVPASGGACRWRRRHAVARVSSDAYEYLMQHCATESGKSKGQFYTPAEVSRIMAKVVGIGPDTRSDHTISSTAPASPPASWSSTRRPPTPAAASS